MEAEKIIPFNKKDEKIQAVLDKIAVSGGDLKDLNESEKATYYAYFCETVGLNPVTQPLSYMTLKGKLTLYAKKDCTDQLRSLKKISCVIVSREFTPGGDVFQVTAQAITPDGRKDESIGAVSVMKYDESKKTMVKQTGEELANSLMKAETKSKRRVTLSICGLGMLDESELDTIPGHTVEEPSHKLDLFKPEIKPVQNNNNSEIKTAQPVEQANSLETKEPEQEKESEQEANKGITTFRVLAGVRKNKENKTYYVLVNGKEKYFVNNESDIKVLDAYPELTDLNLTGTVTEVGGSLLLSNITAKK